MLTVYGINIDGRHRCIVAAKSKAEAARLFKVSNYYFNGWASETWNKEEVELAKNSPGVVFSQLDNNREPYKVRE